MGGHLESVENVEPLGAELERHALSDSDGLACGHVKQRLGVETDATIAGKLAMFGDRIMRAKAKKVEEEFTQALQEKLKAAV